MGWLAGRRVQLGFLLGSLEHLQDWKKRQADCATVNNQKVKDLETLWRINTMSAFTVDCASLLESAKKTHQRNHYVLGKKAMSPSEGTITWNCSFEEWGCNFCRFRS